MSKPIVWSYGGGTQSIALWMLVEQGLLPMPEIIIMADTSREASRTWRYNWTHIFPRMYQAGANVHVAGHNLATVDLYGKNGDLLIPAFTKVGKLPTFCSNEWKTRVVRRYLKALYGKSFACTMWLGMSIDEIERLKPSDVQWIEHHWPLCDMPVSGHYGVRMTRAACEQIVLDAGLPPPPKSACDICPHTTNDVWLKMKQDDPADFAEAVALDYAIRERDQQGGVFLHPDRMPLDTVDFSKPSEPTLFGCKDGFCWT
jgi:hypothetical protein